MLRNFLLLIIAAHLFGVHVALPSIAAGCRVDGGTLTCKAGEP